MGFQIEVNWFIVAKQRSELVEGDGRIALYKEGPRLYPIGEAFTLPIIVEGECMGLGYVNFVGISDRGMTYVIFTPVHIFEEGDPLRKYYEDSFAAYKDRQEIVDDGGRVDLTARFIERLHKEVSTS